MILKRKSPRDVGLVGFSVPLIAESRSAEVVFQRYVLVNLFAIFSANLIDRYEDLICQKKWVTLTLIGHEIKHKLIQ